MFLNDFGTLKGHLDGGTHQVDGNVICETEREFRTRNINMHKRMVEGMAVKGK